MEKKARSSLILILANSRQCNSYTRLYYTRLDYTTCGYVLALDSPLCYSSACCYGFFMKHFSTVLIRTVPRDHAGKKNLTKLVVVSYQ